MVEIIRYGEDALLISFPQEISINIHEKVLSLYKNLLESPQEGILSITPAYCSIVIRFNQLTSFESVSQHIERTQQHSFLTNKPTRKQIKVPVCYHQSLALDLDEVCSITGLTNKEVINTHTKQIYLVYMIGFTPGFPYLGELAPQLIVPRKTTPRLQVPKGAVGLANNQTGIYPSSSPGGWQIIGQTPIELFSPITGCPINIGDEVQFEEISLDEFNRLKQ